MKKAETLTLLNALKTNTLEKEILKIALKQNSLSSMIPYSKERTHELKQEIQRLQLLKNKLHQLRENLTIYQRKTLQKREQKLQAQLQNQNHQVEKQLELFTEENKTEK